MTVKIAKVDDVGPAPDFLPDWLFAYPYPHNVVNEGIAIPGCTGQYCSYLPLPVFPTPFYETLICLLLFVFIWSRRKRFTIPGTLFAFYLILNGLERFLIEKIRVNSKYSIFGFHPTQGARAWIKFLQSKFGFNRTRSGLCQR